MLDYRKHFFIFWPFSDIDVLDMAVGASAATENLNKQGHKGQGHKTQGHDPKAQGQDKKARQSLEFDSKSEVRTLAGEVQLLWR